MASTPADPAEAEAIFEAARPLFAGHSADIVGAALMQLTALWLAGFRLPASATDIEEVRADIMEDWVEAVLEMAPLMEAELRKGRTL